MRELGDVRLSVSVVPVLLAVGARFVGGTGYRQSSVQVNRTLRHVALSNTTGRHRCRGTCPPRSCSTTHCRRW